MEMGHLTHFNLRRQKDRVRLTVALDREKLNADVLHDHVTAQTVYSQG